MERDSHCSDNEFVREREITSKVMVHPPTNLGEVPIHTLRLIFYDKKGEGPLGVDVELQGVTTQHSV